MSATAKESPKKPQPADDRTLLSQVTKYFKFAAGTLAIWTVGYFKFSPSWLLVALVVYIWKQRHVKQRHRQIQIQQQLAQDEQRTILANMEDLPSWVHFPDVERAEWLNKMIDQIWPYIGSYVENLLRTSIQDKVRASHSTVSSFEFTKIDLGDIPPRIGGVKVYTQHVRRDEIYMDLDIIYSSDCLIEVKVKKGIAAGIKDLQLRGALRVIFKPLIGQIPLFGGLSVFFLNNPTIDFNLMGIANALDLPGLNDLVYTQIQEIVASIMVLPNRISVPIVEGVNISLLKYPPPEGVLRIYVKEAQKLEKKDFAGKSDPYAVVNVGADKFKTKVIDNTTNPTWNAVFEAIIDAKDKQYVDIELFDKDPDKDDKLGNVSMEIASAVSEGTMESWLPLNDAKSGMILLKLVWMYLANDPAELERIVDQMKADRTTDDLSSCLLMVNLDSARELPRGKKQMSEPNPYVKLKMVQKEFESDVKSSTDSPVWEQNFRFLVHNPHVQELECEIYDKKSGNRLGNVTVPLKNILNAPEMTLDQYFNLNNSGPESQINMRLALRVLTTEYNPAWTTENLMKPSSSQKDEAEKEAEDAKQKDAAPPVSALAKKDEIIVERTKKVETMAPEGKLIPPASSKSQSPSMDADIRQRSVPATKGAYGHGRIQVTFRYSSQRKSLAVVVHKCSNLLACDDDGLADPYVKLYLLPDRSSSGKRKTQILKNILDPVYDETFSFSVNPGELASRQLEIIVTNDTSRFSSNIKFMGIVAVDMRTLDQTKATTTWFDLMPEDMEGKVVPIVAETQTDV